MLYVEASLACMWVSTLFLKSSGGLLSQMWDKVSVVVRVSSQIAHPALGHAVFAVYDSVKQWFQSSCLQRALFELGDSCMCSVVSRNSRLADTES